MSFRPALTNLNLNNPNPNNSRFGSSSVSKNYGFASPREEGNQYDSQIEVERKKNREMKQRYEDQLDAERKMRIELENKLIKIKDEFSRKDVERSELEFKLSNFSHQQQGVMIENEKLRSEIGRLEEVYGGKIFELQDQIAASSKEFETTTLQYNDEFEKFRKEGQEYVEQLSFEFQRKIKNIEERAKAAEAAKKDLTLQNSKLNDILISNKLAFEEEIREVKSKAKDEEIKRAQQMAKTFEQRAKMIEEGKEQALKKTAELARGLQDKDRAIQSMANDYEDEISRMKEEMNSSHQQCTQLNYIVNKLKVELNEKDGYISQSLNNNDQELGAYKQQVELKKQQAAQLMNTNRDLRQALKDSEMDWERRRKELVERTNIMESEARKYKDEYNRVCDMLRNRINDAFSGVARN